MAKIIQFKNSNEDVLYTQKYSQFILLGKNTEPLTWNVKDVWNAMPYTKIIASATNKLSYYNDGVRVGAGVKRVRIYGQIIFDYSASGTINSDYIFMRLSKNNTGLVKTISPILRWGTLNCETIVDVNEGDIIKVDVLKSTTTQISFYDFTANFGQGAGCYLLVEVVENGGGQLTKLLQRLMEVFRYA